MADGLTPAREGDEYVLPDGRIVIVDGVAYGMVAYRVTDGSGGLLSAARADMQSFAEALEDTGGRRG